MTPPGGVTDVLSVAAGNAILDLDVVLVAPHTWVGDLGFALDDGTRTALLIDRPGHPATAYGCSRDDIDAVLDGEAASPAEDACSTVPPALGGPLAPNGDLAVFAGATLEAVHDTAATLAGLVPVIAFDLDGERCAIPGAVVPAQPAAPA